MVYLFIYFIYFIEVHRHDDGTAALSFKLFKVLCHFKLFGPFYYKAAVFAHPTDATGEKSPAPPGLVDRPRALGFLPALRVTQAGTGILLSHFLSWRMLSWRGTAIVFA